MTVVEEPAARTAARARGGLEEELAALRDKAARIIDELAALHRRMDDLQEQIEAHQRR